MTTYNTAADYVKVEALIQLRDFLAINYEVVQEHLDMESFCTEGETIQDSAAAVAGLAHKDNCGTTMCLAGWASVIPSLRKAFAERDMPDEKRQDIAYFSYMAFFTESDPENGIWDYLFSDLWDNDLDHGLKRINTVIDAARNEDLDTLEYFKVYGQDLAVAVSNAAIDPDNDCVFERYSKEELRAPGVGV